MKPTLEMRALAVKQQPEEVSGLEAKEKIRLRAYQLYEERGREEGHDVEDWLQAESELAVKSIAA